jgi:hypothetical protein
LPGLRPRYVRPRHSTPRPESTRTADSRAIAANAAIPSGANTASRRGRRTRPKPHVSARGQRPHRERGRQRGDRQQERDSAEQRRRVALGAGEGVLGETAANLAERAIHAHGSQRLARGEQQPEAAVGLEPAREFEIFDDLAAQRVVAAERVVGVARHQEVLAVGERASGTRIVDLAERARRE